MWNPNGYKVLSPDSMPAKALYVPKIGKLKSLDTRKFNLWATTHSLPKKAQLYFDSLDLKKVVADNHLYPTLSSDFRFHLFRVPSKDFGSFSDIARDQLPIGKHRDDFISTMNEVASIQRRLLGDPTSHLCVITLPGTRRRWHPDPPKIRSLWQPNGTNPSDTTLIADDSFLDQGHLEANGIFHPPAEIDKHLISVAPLSALMFWQGRRLHRPRIHSEPDIEPTGRPRMILAADPVENFNY